MRAWSLGREDPLEEDLATHSSILVWNPMDRGWQAWSIGSQRVGHDWSDLLWHSTQHKYTQCLSQILLRLPEICSLLDFSGENHLNNTSPVFKISYFLHSWKTVCQCIKYLSHNFLSLYILKIFSYGLKFTF